MKEKIKQLDWKDIGWKCLKLFLFILLNTPTILFIVGKCIEIQVNDNFTVDWINWLFFYAKNNQGLNFLQVGLLKATLYGSMGLTIFATYKINVFLYKQKKEEQRTQKQIEQNEANTNKIIQAIKSKEEKNVDKYL